MLEIRRSAKADLIDMQYYLIPSYLGLTVGPGFSLALVVVNPFLASPVEFSLGLSPPSSALLISVFLFCFWSLDLCLNLTVLGPLSWWSLKSCP